ncbi:MAG TPA: peptidyl-prolyl cis-trans isomerase [Candidatus Binatia bacterium]|nr:peptidyl-prolyl cis-trans isomerase [Candidatus Binatia bacterium]
MKQLLSIPVLLLVALSAANAQLVSSHEPTVAAQPAGHTSMLGTTTLQPAGKPVARVNGSILTDRDLVREEYTIFPYARQHNGIPTAMEADIRNGAMKMMEFEELVYQEAKRRNVSISPVQLQEAQKSFRKQFATPQEYQELLNSEFKGSKALLDTKIERSLLIEKMMKLEITDKSVVSLAEARAYYDRHPEQFKIPESYAVQTISIIPPDNATPEQQKEARKKADNALRQAKETKNYEEFGLLAEKISEDDYRVMMGDHRATDITKLPQPVAQALKIMKPGEMSGLIELDGHAYTIVRLNAYIPSGQQKFDAVRDGLREQLKKQKTEALRCDLDKRLRKNAKVE